jgi:hypothetical protein
MQLTGQVAFDNVTVRNNGTASIYYDWQRVESENKHLYTLKEFDQKFYCHHEQNVIKPGESKKFIFAFISKITGIFNEEWLLKCEPPTIQHLPNLKLSGNAISEDNLKDWRHTFDTQTYNHFIEKSMNEIVNDVVEAVKTPTPPLPDLEDPEICRREFEEKNKEQNLWYNPLVIKWFRHLENEIYEILKLNPQEMYWDLNVSYLSNLIQRVDDEEIKAFLEDRFASYVDLSKKRPVERSLIYPEIGKAVVKLVESVPALADNARKELDMWDYAFKIPKDTDPTEEEKKKEADDF